LGLPDKSSLILLFRKDGLDHSLNFEGQEGWFHSKNTKKFEFDRGFPLIPREGPRCVILSSSKGGFRPG